MKPQKKKSKDEQYQKFKDAARELGTDDSEERFDDTLRRLAKAKQTRIEPPEVERDGCDDDQAE